MNIQRLFIQLNALFFVGYGLGFMLFPDVFANWVTDATPQSPSSRIDMRATYGGMSVAVGIIFLLLAHNRQTLKTGLICVALMMGGMASGRTVGILLDGSPNFVMWLFLAAEVLVILASVALLRQMPQNELES